MDKFFVRIIFLVFCFSLSVELRAQEHSPPSLGAHISEWLKGGRAAQPNSSLDELKRENGRGLVEAIRLEALAQSLAYPLLPELAQHCHRDVACWNMADAQKIVASFDGEPELLLPTVSANQFIVDTMLASSAVASQSIFLNLRDKGYELDARIYARALPAIVLRSVSYAPLKLTDHDAYDEEIFGILLNNAIRRDDELNREFFLAELNDVSARDLQKLDSRTRRHVLQFIQHADHDPAFQLEMLPLVQRFQKIDPTSAGDSLYLLTDRVYLKIFGFQPYGTQLGCVKHLVQPRGSQDVDAINSERKREGLPPYAEYLSKFPSKC